MLQTCSQSQLQKKDENKRIIITKTLVLNVVYCILIVERNKRKRHRMTKTTSWTTARGSKMTASVTISKDVVENIVNLDGDIVNLGSKTVDTLNVTVSVNGFQKCSDDSLPHIITKEWYRVDYDRLTEKGIYARVGDMYLTQDQYNQIMDLANKINEEITITAEYTETKETEAKATQRQLEEDIATVNADARDRKNGLCPKCGTYCYGDC